MAPDPHALTREEPFAVSLHEHEPVVARRARVLPVEIPAEVLKLMVEPAAIGQVINIGNTEEVTIAALAERVRSLTGSQSVIKLIPYDEAYESGFEDMPRRVPDLSKAEHMIGYQPRHTLDDILTQVIDYFRRK